MRTLIITPHPPFPAQQGAALRNLGLLHCLKLFGAQVTLLTFSDSDSLPDEAPARLADLCEQVIYAPAPPRSMPQRLRDLLLTREPDLARRLDSSEFVRRLTDLLQSRGFDLVQFEGLETASYAPIVRRIQPTARIVYDAHNAEFALQRSMARVESLSLWRLPAALYSRTQARRITQFERAVCERADAVIAVSQDDAEHLSSLETSTPIHTLPNGIFADDYMAGGNHLELSGIPLVFTGKMDYRPNVDAIQWFAEAIFGDILTQHSEAKLYVVGQAVHGNLLVLQQSNPRIAFTGWVESVKPFLHHATVFVAPLRMGSGTRLKILEAMAAGCAIVATTVAISGLEDAVRDALIVADTAQGFSSAVSQLIGDSGARQRLSVAARRYACERYDWSILAPRLRQIYAGLGVG
ncbi:MAG: glycosyltransferase [Anaerolineae bacterium]|nr:glycosyltransferase [Anaerolineae bacterium]